MITGITPNYFLGSSGNSGLEDKLDLLQAPTDTQMYSIVGNNVDAKTPRFISVSVPKSCTVSQSDAYYIGIRCMDNMDLLVFGGIFGLSENEIDSFEEYVWDYVNKYKLYDSEMTYSVLHERNSIFRSNLEFRGEIVPGLLGLKTFVLRDKIEKGSSDYFIELPNDFLPSSVFTHADTESGFSDVPIAAKRYLHIVVHAGNQTELDRLSEIIATLKIINGTYELPVTQESGRG